jgi:hypothetical protein
VVPLGVAGALLLRGEHAVVGDTLLLRVALVGAAAGVTACAAQEAGALRDARAWSLPRPPTTQLRAAAAVYIAIGQVLLTAFLMGLGLTLTETVSTALGALLVLSAAGALAALAGAVASATRFQKLPIAAAFAAVPLLAAADPGPRAFTAAAMVLGVETILWRWKWL